MLATSVLSRSQFLRVLAGGATLGAFAVMTACGGGDDGDDDPATDGAAPDGAAPDAPAGDGPLPIDASPVDARLDAATSCAANGTTVDIAGNHGHSLVVSAADVSAAQPRTYDIQGGGSHAHAVTISAAQFNLLAQNTTIQVTSTNTGHTHVVTVSCA